MTAPARVGLAATTASATTTLTCGAAVGDLLVLYAIGTQTAFPNGTVDVAGATDSGWTLHGTVDGSGSTRTRAWSKVATSADINSTTTNAIGPTGMVSNGTSRLVLVAYRHADGFDAVSANRLVGSASHNTNVSNGSSVASISGGVRKLVALSGVTFGSAQTTLQHTWDSDAAADPAVSETGGTNTGTGVCQVGEKLYDTAETVDVTYNVGLNNTTHAILTLVFKTKPPAQTVAVGTATETDTAMAIGHSKSRAITTAVETDTAFPIVRSVVGVVGTALETDTAMAIGHYKTRAVGTATETDTAFSIAHGKLVAVGTAETSEAGLPVTWTKSTTVVVALSTPAAAAYATKILRAWAYTASPTDVAELQLVLLEGTTPITTSAWLPLTNTPTAYELTVIGSISDYANLRAQITTRTTSSAVVRVSQLELELNNEIGTALEVDTAFPIGHSKSLAVGTAPETDTASEVRPTKRIAIGTALEVDTARPITVLVARDLTMTYGALVKKWSAQAPTSRWSFETPEV